MMEDKQKQITEEQARTRLAALCARAEHCTGEMREKMWRWGIAEDAQQRIVDYLVAYIHHYLWRPPYGYGIRALLANSGNRNPKSRSSGKIFP